MNKSFNDKFKKMTDLEKVKAIFDFLTGEEPEGFYLKDQPNLTDDAAISTIYLMQEGFCFISEYIEFCENCKRPFDSREYNSENEFLRCEECGE